MKRPRPLVIVTAITLVMSATALQAHDFWLVPNAFAIAASTHLDVLGQTSSRFPTSEAAVAVDRVADARMLGPSDAIQITDLSTAGSSLRLRARPRHAGQYMIAVSLHWRSLRESPESFRRYLTLEGAPAALERVEREGLLAGRDSVTRRYAKYAKTLVQVGNGGGRAYHRVVGHPLEFIPLRDPDSLRIGDTLAVRLRFQGGAAAGVKVHAGSVEWTGTLARAHAGEPTADIELTADADGVIRIPIATAGLWNVRTLHITQSPRRSGADWDAHWATMVFLVRGQRGQTVPSDSSDVVNTVRAYHRALATGDSAVALGLLTPDAVILESGGIESREEYRRHHLPGDIQFARAVQRHSGAVNVKVHDNVAWAWSTSSVTGEYRGRRINSTGAELMLLTRSKSGWRIAAIHWSSRARVPGATSHDERPSRKSGAGSIRRHARTSRHSIQADAHNLTTLPESKSLQARL